MRVRLLVGSLDSLGEISRRLKEHRLAIEAVQTQRRDPRHFELEVELRLPAGVNADLVITTIQEVADVELLETDRAVE